ncbi:hypothetical protein JOF56_009967 [Kibdelosporangium banguiense]|uniref:Uncharacterized protein n=1 Tax=Kibdelosporangium banguiense TaxID=1365924 RepID=A0ABS4TYU8_9PSEU|nr:hypothetical protein [Kibdelosporangium banguiense]MBP2329582.1 hypothetical protein [Kibdelosporangium banguiense]
MTLVAYWADNPGLSPAMAALSEYLPWRVFSVHQRSLPSRIAALDIDAWKQMYRRWRCFRVGVRAKETMRDNPAKVG